MRLYFNVAVIDDDFTDNKRSRSILRLLETLEEHIANKGFNPEFFKYLSMEDCLEDKNSLDENQHQNRIDLFLSDNNLGGKNEDGIDLYLKLQDTELICDFILYTRSDINEIVKKLSDDLLEKNNPNLFTRFTFVARPGDPSDTSWHDPILKTIDHIITKREEINHLRGLFAQVTAIMHNKLREVLNNDKLTFEDAIDEAENKGKINKKLKDWLHNQRLRRNSILHNDEAYDPIRQTFTIQCEERHNTQTYSFRDFPKLRKQLFSTKEEFDQQIVASD